MNRCQDCGVYVYTQHSKCPLCLSDIDHTKDTTYNYPEYTDLVLSRFLKAQSLSKHFIKIFSIIISIVNVLTYAVYPRIYAFALIMFFIYLYILIFDTLNMQHRLGRRIINNFIVLSIFCISIDLALGFNAWSFEYVLPLLSIAFSILSLMNLMIYEKEFEDSVVYILAMLLFNILPILLWLILGLTVIWPSIASLSLSLLIVLLMILFTRKQFSSEIKKRFHT